MFFGARLPIDEYVRALAAMPWKAAPRKHFPSGQAIIRLINKKWAVYAKARKTAFIARWQTQSE